MLVCSALGGLLNAPARGEEPDAVLGTWLTENKTAHVKVHKKSSEYFGKIVWLRNPNNDDGTPKRDTKNPDPELRSRTVRGLTILRGLEYDGNHQWTGGKIYDPNNGKTYSCKMTLASPDTLNIRGFVGISLLGRTSHWTRVDSNTEDSQ
jgi:uncharacterized protein (DUF2147 family)